MKPAEFFLGLGHESGADVAVAMALVEQCCRKAGFTPSDVALMASLDTKETGSIVAAVARHFDCEIRYFSAAALEAETPRLLNPSDTVFRAVGCHGVAEAAALAAAGPVASLIVPKTAGKGVTCAIARRGDPGR